MRLLGVEIVGAIGRRSEQRAVAVTSVSTDSRTVRPGDVFFALEGQRTDGHAHVLQALENGAAAAVVHRDITVPDTCAERVLRVDDTLKALGRAARDYRRKWGGRVVAVTGSNGKTTTREMLYHILSGFLPCKRSPKSFNTNIGVPLTLFQAEAEDRVLVVEMGANAPGEIRELVEIAEPNDGIITNVAESHLEGLGSVEGVAHAKAELLDGLGEAGMAFLNADDDWFNFFAARHDGPMMSYGICSASKFRARAVRPVTRGHWFLLNGATPVELNVPGLHNVKNAVAALAVADMFGLDLREAAARLAEFRPPPLRCQVEDIQGVQVFADCYNANPGSVRAALEALRDLPVDGRRIVVLGDMLELGDASEELHAALGRDLTHYGVSAVWAVGRYAECLAAGAADNGLEDAACAVRTLDEAIEPVRQALRPGDALLVKGSRGMTMEKLVESLKAAVPVPA